MVTVKRTYRVLIGGQEIGTWSREDPASWDAEMRWFHKNGSSWCTDNMRDEGELHLSPGCALPPETHDGCLCSGVELVPVDEPEYREAHNLPS